MTNDKKLSATEILGTGEMPAVGNRGDVARAVYALYEYGVANMLPFWRVSDRDRNYYKGSQCPIYQLGDQKCYENAVQPAVETMKPIIINAVSKVEIAPLREDDVKPAESLNQRVKWGLKKSHFDIEMPKIVHDILIDGHSCIAGLKNCTAIRVDNRTIIFDVANDDLDHSFFIIEQFVMSKGEAKDVFGKTAEALIPKVQDLESNKYDPRGPVSIVNPVTDALQPVSVQLSDGTVGGYGQTFKYDFNDWDTQFQDAEKVLILGCWVRDMRGKYVSKKNAKTGKGYREWQLTYPAGRHIFIGVGVKPDKSKDATDMLVLRDEPNPFEKLFRKTNRFPYVDIPCYETSAHLGMSVVSQLVPIQDALNSAHKRLLKNMRRSVKPRNIWAYQSGIQPKDNTDADHEDIHLSSSSGNLRPAEAVYTMVIPSIIQHLIPLIALYRFVIKEMSGTNDVMRGGVPAGVTSGIAISELQQSSNSRPLQKGDIISKGMIQVAEMLAYIAQDFDEEEQEMEFPDDSGTESTFIKYRPGVTANLGFRIIGTRKKSLEEVAQVTVLIANLKQSGVDPKFLLHYLDDSVFEKLYREAEESMLQQQQTALTAQAELADKQQNAKFAQELTKEAIATRSSKGRDNA